MPVQTQEKTRQVTNPQVQHVVNAVEAEMPKIIKETMQRKRPIINEKINQVTKHAEVSQVQVVEKTVEGPQLQIVEQIVETPEAQTIQGIQTSECLDTAPFRQVSQAGVGEVHPTGVVKPDDPETKIKFLTEEALHGVGGFVFDAHGNRVANELGGRNCVTGEMWKNKPPFSVALNKVISDDIVWQCKHCTGRGIRKFHESGAALAEDVEAPVSKMPDSSEAHCQASLKTTRDPNGGPYPAFSSGKSWNEASGKTGSEKKFYHNVSSGADFAAQPFCVAEYVGPTPEVTYGHDAHAVECVTPSFFRCRHGSIDHKDSGTQTGPPDQRVQKMEEVPQVQFIDIVIDILVISERQMSMMNQVQKTVEVPRVQFIDRLVDDPAVMRKEAASNMALSEEEGQEQTEARSLGQGRERGCEEDETDAQGPGSELVQVAPNMGAGGSHPQATMDQEWDKELSEIGAPGKKTRRQDGRGSQ